MTTPPTSPVPRVRHCSTIVGILTLVLALMVLPGCRPGDTGTDDARTAGAVRCAEPGGWSDCEVTGHDDRGYDVYVPTRAASGSVPLMVALHGAGGRSETAVTMACNDGDRSDASCLHTIAEDEGFAVVYPNGSGFLPFRRLRLWNAGGGGDWDCTSGRACEDEVDDIDYLSAVLDDVGSWLDIDPGRITIVGHSNGGAMSHRLACELSDRVAAIAAVGGTNQFVTTTACEPEQPGDPGLGQHGDLGVPGSLRALNPTSTIGVRPHRARQGVSTRSPSRASINPAAARSPMRPNARRNSGSASRSAPLRSSWAS